jgi:hypothetical protein
MAEAGSRFAFNVEWSDPTNGVVFTYVMRHYPATRELELVGYAYQHI